MGQISATGTTKGTTEETTIVFVKKGAVVKTEAIPDAS